MAAVAREVFVEIHCANCNHNDWEATKKGTQALVTLLLDYYKALYMGLLLKTMQKLQLVKIAVAQLIMGVQFYWMLM